MPHQSVLAFLEVLEELLEDVFGYQKARVVVRD
jgi:hypothetical protein